MYYAMETLDVSVLARVQSPGVLMTIHWPGIKSLLSSLKIDFSLTSTFFSLNISLKLGKTLGSLQGGSFLLCYSPPQFRQSSNPVSTFFRLYVSES